VTIADVLRLLLDGLKAVGGISEQQHAAAHAAVSEHDDNTEAARPTFSDVQQAELDKLLAAKQAAEGTPAEPAEAPTPPVVAEPGGGFFQPPTTVSGV
jgi:hypothetical protein